MRVALLVALAPLSSSLIAADPLPAHVPSRADLERAHSDRPERTGGRVHRTRLNPHWFEGGLWYRRELRGGGWEFAVVRVDERKRRLAFDHDRVAAQLREAGVRNARSDRLPITDLEFAEGGRVTMHAAGKAWAYDPETNALESVDAADTDRPDEPNGVRLETIPTGSARTGEESELTFVNETAAVVTLYWLDREGGRRSYGRLPAGETHAQHTYGGHVWLVVDGRGRTLAAFRAEDRPARALVTGDPSHVPRRRTDGRDRRGNERRRRNGESPDGRWRATIETGNVVVRSTGDDSESHQLTTDGAADHSYGRLEWSPDSRTLVAFHVRPGDRHEVHLVASSPKKGGRAELRSRPYALPGDRMTSYELHLFSTDGWTPIPADVEPVDFGSPRLRWLDGGREFVYEKVDRGHQRFRMIAVDVRTGAHRTVLDERTDTFVWTSHTEQRGIRLVTWLDDSDRFVYASEVDGRRHLYLVDAAAPDDETERTRIENGGHSLAIARLVNRITEGAFVVRGIDRIDDEERIWFRASGGSPGRDPYYVHFYRVNLAGTELVPLTGGDGTHAVEFSPDRRFLVDTYSRADQPPIHELRSAEDGRLIVKLDEADATELEEAGWSPPERFVAKGRDGETDIWGLIHRPRDFDPAKRYPVVEAIYAGPHGSHVPKGFRTGNPYAALHAAGFVVVKIDGMGTANRTKAFHDVCWRNLKDAGFPDRIAWMRAAAEKYQQFDLDRVGIYGGSAGGQNAAAAVLFHSDFYKVAVAGCGCHDNRMDKASWNEQWMGYPVGPWYGQSSNIDNAHRLGGRLLLIVGELDTNVPPESTLRFADALIRAGKDFDLVVVPNAGHGMGGRYGQRKLLDFFAQHLHGIAPPNRNAR